MTSFGYKDEYVYTPFGATRIVPTTSPLFETELRAWLSGG